MFCIRYGIALKQWEKTKERFEIATRDPAGDPDFEKRRLLVLAWIRYNKTAVLLRWIVNSERDRKIKEVCEIAGIKWIEDPQARFKYLSSEIKKAEKKAQRLSKDLGFEEDIEEEIQDPEEEKRMDTIYDSIASLELYGFNIPDYDSLTVPKYIAMTRVANKQTQKAEEHG